MNFPTPLSSVVDLTGLQNAVALILMSDDRLAQVPVIPEWKLHMESDVQVDALWTLPRSCFRVTGGSVEVQNVAEDSNDPQNTTNPVGAGLLVEMPEGSTAGSNPTGPPLNWDIHVVAFEERNVSWNPATGAMVTAEQLAQVVLDILHLQVYHLFGTISAKVSGTIGPARDWMSLPGKEGLNVWRATLRSTQARDQTPRTQVAQCSFDSGQATLACPDPAAVIRYTLDGTAPVSANPSALQYNGPFAVPSGTLVLYGAKSPGRLAGPINGKVAP